MLIENQRMLIQMVEYQLFGADNALIAASVERLRLWWFNDKELETLAQKGGVRTRANFDKLRIPSQAMAEFMCSENGDSNLRDLVPTVGAGDESW